MQLLVSVADGDDARAALEGGADIIDTKDPSAGPLGAVSLDTFGHIHSIVAGARPVSAALGDAIDEASIERAAREYGASGAVFVKIGFDGITAPQHVESLLAAAVRGARRAGSQGTIARVVGVTYADQSCIARDTFLRLAARAGAAGVLIDTADKRGAGLRNLIPTNELRALIDAAHDAGLLIAAAGRLTIADLEWVRDCGADIAGVRGAACVSGRTSRVAADKVRLLRSAATPRLAPV